MNRILVRVILLSSVAALAAGCSINTDNVLPDKTVEYKRERQAERGLEVPPDLTSSTINDQMGIPEVGGASASYQDFVTQQRQAGAAGVVQADVLPETRDITVMREGDVRWLLIEAPPEAVWPRLVDFWQQNGILLQEQDPTVGIMRTAWLENRADIKSDFITNAVRSVFEGLYETGTRDQYRLRLEEGVQRGSTELYLTHFGMKEELTQSAGQSDRPVWVPRARDPGLEAIMLRRIMVFLGEAEERAAAQLASRAETGAGQQAPRSQLVKNQAGSVLLVDDTFAGAWRLVGLALDRVGFAVEDRDRSSGIYYVRYHDPAADTKDEGWLSKLSFWSDDKDVDKQGRYRVKVAAGERGTEVTVLDEQGQRQNTPTADRILTLLHEQIR